MPLSRSIRMLALVAGLGTATLLMVARSLEPAAVGMGTHQQLGLPACTALVLFGKPCPACGMTTAWALTTRGAWWQAAEVNAGGFLLAVIAMAYLPASCYFFAIGRATRGGWFSLVLGISLLSALLVAIVQWSVRFG